MNQGQFNEIVAELRAIRTLLEKLVLASEPPKPKTNTRAKTKAKATKESK